MFYGIKFESISVLLVFLISFIPDVCFVASDGVLPLRSCLQLSVGQRNQIWGRQLDSGQRSQIGAEK